MSEPDSLIKYKICSTQRINSLNLPTAIGKLKSVILLLSKNVLIRLRFHLLNVFIIYHLQLKGTVLLLILLLLSRQVHVLLTTCWFFNLLDVVHPSDLVLKEIWDYW